MWYVADKSKATPEILSIFTLINVSLVSLPKDSDVCFISYCRNVSVYRLKLSNSNRLDCTPRRFRSNDSPPGWEYLLAMPSRNPTTGFDFVL